MSEISKPFVLSRILMLGLQLTIKKFIILQSLDKRSSNANGKFPNTL